MAIKRYTFQNQTDHLNAIRERMKAGRRNTWESKSWTGESFSESMTLTEKGDTKAVPEAEKLLEKVLTDVSISRHDWINSMAGAFPDVPAFLSGVPENMRARVPQPRSNTPIKIFVNLTSSAGVTYEELLKRGITILALALQMQKFRQIEIYVYTCVAGSSSYSDDVVTITKLGTSPVSLSEAAYCLCSTGYSRNISYCLGVMDGASGSWPKESNCRKQVDAGPKDLMIEPWSMYNKEIRMMIEDPVTWINNQMKTYIGEQEEE